MARDVFLDGLPREFQILLKRDKTTNAKVVKELAEEVNQLRLGGIPSVRPAPANASPVNQSSLPASAVNQVSGCDMEIYNDMSSTRQTVTAFGNDSLDTQATVQSMRGRSRGRRWTPRMKYQQPRDPMLGKRCYIWGDINHLQFSCPHFHDCHRCLRLGHVARNCAATSPASKRGGQITNLATALHGLIMVTANIDQQPLSFLVDTEADISLIPLDVVQMNHMTVRRNIVRQPIMVDGTTLQCEGTVVTSFQLGSQKVYSPFYVAKGIDCGVLGTDVLSTLEVQIDVANRKSLLKGEEVTTFQPVKSEPTRSEERLLKFGRVYSPSSVLFRLGQETTIWGNIHSNATSEWTGIVEVVDELSERSGLLGCATYCVGEKRRDVPVSVMNVCTEPVVVHEGQSLAEFTEATALDGVDRRPVGKSTDIYNSMVDIDLGESLSSEEKQQLENLLKRHRDVFA